MSATYGRNGRSAPPAPELAQQAASSHPGQPGQSEKEQMVSIDGFKQVLEMLKIADPQFRESLLRRLAQKDVELARSLRADLRDLGL